MISPNDIASGRSDALDLTCNRDGLERHPSMSSTASGSSSPLCDNCSGASPLTATPTALTAVA